MNVQLQLPVFLAQGGEDWSTAEMIGLALASFLAVAAALFFITFGKLYLQAMSSGCHVPVVEFVGMYLRKVSARVIVDTMVMAHKAGIEVDIEKLQAHVLARGNLRIAVQAIVAASRCGNPNSPVDTQQNATLRKPSALHASKQCA